MFTDFSQTATAAAAASGSATARMVVGRDVARDKKEAVEDLKRLAAACGVVTG